MTESLSGKKNNKDVASSASSTKRPSTSPTKWASSSEPARPKTTTTRKLKQNQGCDHAIFEHFESQYRRPDPHLFLNLKKGFDEWLAPATSSLVSAAARWRSSTRAYIFFDRPSHRVIQKDNKSSVARFFSDSLSVTIVVIGSKRSTAVRNRCLLVLRVVNKSTPRRIDRCIPALS